MFRANPSPDQTGTPPFSMTGPGRTRRRPARRALVAISATAVMALGSFAAASPASAAPGDNDPIGGLVHGLTKTVHHVTTPKQHSPSTSSGGSSGHSGGGHSSSGSSGSSGHTSSGHSSSGGHSTGSHSSSGSAGSSSSHTSTGSSAHPSTSPTRLGSGLHPLAPRPHRSGGTSTSADHASGSAATVRTSKKRPAAALSSGSSQAYRNRASADAKLLEIGGYSVIGSHADSAGDGTGHGPVPQVPVCRATDGKLCLDLLYAESRAGSTAAGSQAGTRTGVADLCLGGDDSSGASCSGLHLGAAQSQSDVRTSPDGTKDSTSSGSLLDVCAEQDASCLLAARALGSSSASGSHAGEAQKPSLLSVLLDDFAIDAPDDPIDVDVTKDCETNVVCATLNDKTTQPGSDDSGSAADLTGLGDNLGAGVGSSDAGSSLDHPTDPANPGSGAGSEQARWLRQGRPGRRRPRPGSGSAAGPGSFRQPVLGRPGPDPR